MCSSLGISLLGFMCAATAVELRLNLAGSVKFRYWFRSGSLHPVDKNRFPKRLSKRYSSMSAGLFVCLSVCLVFSFSFILLFLLLLLLLFFFFFFFFFFFEFHQVRNSRIIPAGFSNSSFMSCTSWNKTFLFPLLHTHTHTHIYIYTYQNQIYSLFTILLFIINQNISYSYLNMYVTCRWLCDSFHRNIKGKVKNTSIHFRIPWSIIQSIN